MTLTLVLLILGAICLFLAALKVKAGRLQLGWAGLLFWLLAWTLTGASMLPLVLMILGLICLLLAAIGVVSDRVELGWLGLFLWLLAQLLRI